MMRIQIIQERLIKRVIAFLVAKREQGAPRSELQQRFHIDAESLDEVLDHLRQQVGFHEWKPDRPGHVATYYAYLPPTPVIVEDGSTRCAWCRTALAPNAPAGSFCGRVCARAAGAAALSIDEWFRRAPTPYAMYDIAVNSVICDLMARGIGVYRTTGTGTRYVLVAEIDGTLYGVRIKTADNEGEVQFDPASVTSTCGVAIVLRSGRILYEGLPLPRPTPATSTDGADVDAAS
jgi:hypothetical protein